jgi:hypothetical protein
MGISGHEGWSLNGEAHWRVQIPMISWRTRQYDHSCCRRRLRSETASDHRCRCADAAHGHGGAQPRLAPRAATERVRDRVAEHHFGDGPYGGAEIEAQRCGMARARNLAFQRIQCDEGAHRPCGALTPASDVETRPPKRQPRAFRLGGSLHSQSRANATPDPDVGSPISGRAIRPCRCSGRTSRRR